MNRFTRLTALLLALMMILSTFAAAETAYQVGDMTTEQWNSIVQNAQSILNEPVIDEGDSGKVITPPMEPPVPSAPYDKTIEVPLGQNKDITTANLAVVKSDVAAQWQIAIKDDLWVNILGETGNTLNVNAGMLQGTAMKVRQAGNDAQVTAFTLSEATAAVQTFAVENRADSTTTTPSAANDVSSLQDANPNIEQWTVEIRYVFADSQNTAANSWTGKVAKNAALYTSAIVLPRVVGYYASTVTAASVDAGSYKFVGQKNSNNNFEDGTIQLEINSVTADLVLYVNYSPAPMDFKVTHVYQDVNGEFPEIPKDGSTVDGITVETKSGMVTGTAVGAVAKKTDGFTNLWYDETVKIAADGSTNIIVYYERDWYLMLFDCNGGYGTEPVYARYGAPLTHKVSTRAGYSFEGWKLIESNGNVVTDAATIAHSALPSTMPAENRTYQAQWKETDLARVRVEIWGENPNDEDYAYLKTIEIYAKPGSTVSFTTANTVCGYTAHTHNESCYDCGVTVHTHGPDCCTIEAHTHSEDCCTIAVHAHDEDCYPNVGTAQSNDPYGAPDNAVDGQIYSYYSYYNGRQRYIYINGIWYRYTGNQNSGTISATCGNAAGSHDDHTCVYCNKTEHTHDGANCIYCSQNLEEHTHTEECFSCTLTEHTHTSSCYITNPNMPSNLWELKTSDTVTVAADGSTVMNVYYDRVEKTLTFKNGNYTEYTLTKKWGADISEYWPIGKEGVSETNSGRVYDDGERWDPSGSSEYSEVLVFLEIMPDHSFTLTVSDVDYDTFIMHYMVEALASETTGVTTYTYGGTTKRFTEAFKVEANYNHVTKAEDFFDVEGFTQWTSNPPFEGNSLDIPGGGDVYFYYTRNSYMLSFNDGYDVVKIESVLYGDSWAKFEEYVPELPSQYEEGSRTFVGWYWNPQGTSDKIVLSAETMPANDQIIYAQWELVDHTLTFYTDEADYKAKTPIYRGPFELTHNDIFDEKVTGADLEAIINPTNYKNENLSFIGWFYVENGEEKAWTPKMAVKKDLELYGKWGLTKPVSFTVYFKLKGFDTLVAETISGQTLVDADSGTQNIDLEAKTGYDLFTQYQTGVFPITTSHTLVVDVKNTNNTYTFEYVEKTAVPYLVRYLIEDANGSIEIAGKKYRALVDSKVVADNRNAIVTEPYQMVPGYMPDEYQKRLIVTGEESNNWITEGNVQIHPDNVIDFIYHVDTENAFYAVEHYIQPVDGDDLDDRTTWTQVGVADSATGKIGLDVTATPRTIPGFTYHDVISESYYKDAGTATVTGNALTTELTDGGVLFKLYYKRNEYPYKVQYLEVDTNVPVQDSKEANAYYQAVVTETAEKLIVYNDEQYELVTSESQQITIQKEETPTLNVITFFYEKRVPITYVAMTKDANGTIAKNNIGGNVDLNDGESNLQPENSEPVRIKTGAALGATAVKNANYKFVGWYNNEACSGTALSTNESYIPKKFDGKNVRATYYALFELDVAPLTIRKTVTGVNKPTGDIFEIQIELKDASDNALSGSYPYGPATDKTGPNGTLTLTNGVGTIDEIKDGDEIVIENVVIGTKFTVTEISKPRYYEETITGGTGSITNAAGALVEIRNAYQAGNLVITKIVDPTTGAPDDTFTMNVTLKLPDTTGATLPTSYNVSYSNSETTGTSISSAGGTITLVAGQSATIVGLPYGTTYKVEETDNVSYAEPVAPAEGTIDSAEETVTVTNEYLTGDLTITKVVGDVGEPDSDSFTIEVALTLPNGQTTLPDSVSYTGGTPTSGKSTTMTFTGIKDGNSITIGGLPYGTTYEVTEATPPQYYNAVANYKYSDSQKKIDSEDSDTVEVTNTYNTGTLEITKKVEGNAPADEFAITVTLTLPKGMTTLPDSVQYEMTAGEYTVSEGNVTYTVGTTGGTLAISGLPVGTKYNVTEAAPPSYYTSDIRFADDDKAITNASEVDEVTVTNTYNTGRLTVEKSVTSDPAVATLPQDTFTIDVALELPKDNGAKVSLDYIADSISSTNGKGATVTKTASGFQITGAVDGTQIVFNNLPHGTKYSVAEIGQPGYFDVKYNGAATAPTNVEIDAISTTSTTKVTSVAITNTYLTGDLEITKVVDGTGMPADDSFTIDVAFKLPEGNATIPTKYTLSEGVSASDQSTTTVDGVKCVTVQFTGVQHTDRIVITGIPYGTTYSVTEETPAAYYTAGYTYDDSTEKKIGNETADKVTVTNTYITGSLDVTKEVVGVTAPRDANGKGTDEFSFTLKLTDKDDPNKLINATINCNRDIDGNGSGIYTFTLKDGETAQFTQLPANVQYTVTETAHRDYTTTQTGDIGVIAADSATATHTAEVKFTNAYKYGDLIITKRATGANAASSTFIFRVEGESFNGYVSITGSDSVTLKDLKPGSYRVIEQTDWSYRFTVDETSATATVVAGETKSVAFTNTEKTDKWLHDESVKTNVFSTTTNTTEGGEQ